MKTRLLALTLLVSLSACGQSQPDIDELAKEYLFLELSMGLHDKAHVDAYFGPEELRTEAENRQLTLDEIAKASVELSSRLMHVLTDDDEMLRQRVFGLRGRLLALNARVAINKEVYLDFDDESLALFGSRAPDYDAAHFQAILDEVDALLPGDGPLAERVEAFNSQFVIPLDKMDSVFVAAMDECRKRTLEYID
ncbi:MAG: hypothetical protein QNJ00_09035, partial [Woeseiaceae bacterium]|nr:hypothetical protein [Woeseiaceae bacterium]